MHEFDKYGELHRKQMQCARNGMLLDLAVFFLCGTATAAIFIFIGWYCKGGR